MSRCCAARILDSSADLQVRASGLLICGFGVQVPGGAPVLTWAFSIASGVPSVRFGVVFGPWVLDGCSDVVILSH
jgi:hypothetical protein